MKTPTTIWSVCALLATAGCGTMEPSPAPKVGDMAPSFRLTNVSDSQIVRSDSLKGDIVVLNFWSTSCANCLEEIDELKTIQADGQANVVGIAIDNDAESVKKVLVAKAINYPVLNGNEEVFAKYDGYSIPYTLVLDETLIIRKKVFGPMKKSEFDEIIASIKTDT